MTAPSPIHRQYLQVKGRYPGCILFFRLGDFYETFEEDAKLVARELEIVLTSRQMSKGARVPMAGVPAHAVESYVGRLLAKGYRVALCEQVGEPGAGRGLLEREVVRIVTPGTVVEPALLRSAESNYLAALWEEGKEPERGGGRGGQPGGPVGLAYVDITTSEFVALQIPSERLAAELERLQPAELLLPEGREAPPVPLRTRTSVPELWAWRAEELLLEHFGAATLEGLGLVDRPAAQRAVALLLRYLEETQRSALRQLTRLTLASVERAMLLDAHTRRNLELMEPLRTGSQSPTLLQTLDLTQTPMGARLLRRWLGQPLLELAPLLERQEGVALFHRAGGLRARAREPLKSLGDLERLANRARSYRALPRELVALRKGLEAVARLREALATEAVETGAVAALRDQLWPAPELVTLLAQALVEDPPPSLSEGGVIRPGYSPELEELRRAAREGRSYLASLERSERERTGIRNLKVGYNRVFGYYIEVSKSNLGQVPSDYLRKQTVVNGERYYTPQLKEYEALILNAEEQALEMEERLFRQLCGCVENEAERLLASAAAAAQLDLLAALAEVAVRHGYCRPKLTEGESIVIRGGRHPLVELSLEPGAFVANDTELSNQGAQIMLLTGPNMAGKSTYLRQVALVVLLAQIGSFVPAEAAELGIVDRIFTRIGAQDDLAAGRSTFMVEMVETAQILHQATPRSLIILDEIGRGTSTYDGLAIARAVVEYLHNHPHLGAKTLFATHYHELTALAETLPRVRNYHVAAREEGGRIVFRYQVLPGGVNRSYGIQVAQLAGLPRPVVQRAAEVLGGLEGEARRRGRRSSEAAAPFDRLRAAPQLPLFQEPSAVKERLLALDLDSLSPLEALTVLYELQREAREEG